MTEQLDLANITDQISQLLSESTASSSNDPRTRPPGRPAGSSLKDLDPQVLTITLAAPIAKSLE